MDCDQNTLIYEDLRCKPIYLNSDENTCPDGYDCSSFDNRPKDKCHYRNEFYKVGEYVKNDLTIRTCYINCICNEK